MVRKLMIAMGMFIRIIDWQKIGYYTEPIVERYIK